MSTVVGVEAVIEVEAPAGKVWSVLADYDRDVEWRKGVKAMNPRPSGLVRVGTTTSEHIRTAGRTMRNDGVVTDVDPDRGFAWRTTSGVSAEGSRRIVAIEAGRCRIELSLRVAPPGLLRLVPRVVQVVLGRGPAADACRLDRLIEQLNRPGFPGGLVVTRPPGRVLCL